MQPKWAQAFVVVIIIAGLSRAERYFDSAFSSKIRLEIYPHLQGWDLHHHHPAHAPFHKGSIVLN